MSELPPKPTQKKSNLRLILIIGGVIFICICLLVGGTFFAVNILGSSIDNVFESVNKTLAAPDGSATEASIPIPATPDITPAYTEPATTLEPTEELVTPEPTYQEPDVSTFIPEGGLGDETLRASTWGYVFLFASIANCELSDASSTQIEVSQQPDASGKWMELWTVSCNDGTTRNYNVTFTPSANGTDISVEEAK